MPKRRRAVLLCGPARATLAAIARELAGPETSLLVQAAPREAGAADRLCRALTRRGGAAQVIPAQLRGDDEARRLVVQAWKTAARAIDTVVICAAPSATAPAAQPSLAEWQDSIAVGLRAPFFVARQAGLRMAKQGGRLIFAFAAPPRGAGPTAGVVHAGLLCMIDALSKALPSRVAVTAVIGGGRPSTSAAAQIARGVRFFSDAERRSSGAVLDLAPAVHRG